MLWRGQLHTNKTQRNRYGKQIRDKFYLIYQVVPNVDNEVGKKVSFELDFSSGQERPNMTMRPDTVELKIHSVTLDQIQ